MTNIRFSVKRIVSVWTTLLILTAGGASAPPPKPIPKAVLNGLRWYFHWMHSLPEGTDSLGCRGVVLNESAFAYCDPGRVTLELINSPRHLPNVEFIGVTTEEYSKAVNWFRELHGAQVRQNFHLSIQLAEISKYEIDRDRSESWMQTARVFMASTLRGPNTKSQGVRFLFPWVSTDDPAYQVYLTVDGRVDSIWEFRVIDGKVQDYKRWVYDNPHKSIPTGAQAFSEDPARWYRIVSESEKR